MFKRETSKSTDDGTARVIIMPSTVQYSTVQYYAEYSTVRRKRTPIEVQ